MAKKMLKRNLLTSLVAMALSTSMFVGTTFAWFTDSVTSTNNVIKTGNLDVNLYYQVQGQTDWTEVGEKTNVFMEDALWEPGHTEVVKLKVVNEGTLALKYQLGVNVASETGSINVNNEAFKLSDYIKYGIVDGDQTYTTREDAVSAVNSTATALNTDYNSGTTALEAKNKAGDNNYEDVVTMVVYMPETVGDEANYKKDAAVPTINLGINLYATQVANENDSFDNKYDDEAWVNGMKVFNANDLQAAISAGENVVVMEDIEVTKPIVISAPEATTYSLRATPAAQVIDLNGNTITAAYVKGSTTNHVYAFENYGNIVIKNGTINARGIFNYGTMTLENGAVINAIDGNGGYAVRNYEGAKLVMNAGTKVATTLEDDYKVNNGGYDATTVRVDEGAEFVMNGGVINNICDYTFAIENYGKVTVNDGVINSVHSTLSTYGEVTINGGQFTCNGVEGVTAHAVVAWEGSTTVINGGTFDGKDNYNGFNIDACAGSIVNVYGGNFLPVHSGSLYGEGTINVYGGTYFDDVTARVVNGYQVVNANGTYKVIFPQESFNSLIENAEAGATVEVPAGEYTFPGNAIQEDMVLNCAEGTVFEGTSSLNINGATVIGATFENEGGVAVSGTINGTFKNCTFEGEETLRWCYTSAGQTVVFEDCVIKTDLRGVHFDGMDGDVIFRNCEINGFNAYSGTGNMLFENCTFGNDQSRFNGLNIYTNTTLKNCTFKYISGKTNFIDMEGTGKTLTITGCTATLDGKATDVLNFVGGSKLAENTVVVDGEKVFFANNTDELVAAINSAQAGGTIYLSQGDYALRFTNNTAFNVDGLTIVGVEGTNLSISSTEGWYGRIQGNEVTFENIHFTSSVGATGKATYNNCTFDSWALCASSGNANTYFNNCVINGCLNTSTDLSSGDTYVNNCKIVKAEFSGSATMNFEDCKIGELISWDMKTVLTNCTVTNLDESHMANNQIIIN